VGVARVSESIVEAEVGYWAKLDQERPVVGVPTAVELVLIVVVVRIVIAPEDPWWRR